MFDRQVENNWKIEGNSLTYNEIYNSKFTNEML